MHTFIKAKFAGKDIPVGRGVLIKDHPVTLYLANEKKRAQLFLYGAAVGPGCQGWSLTQLCEQDPSGKTAVEMVRRQGSWDLEQGGSAALLWVESATPTNIILNRNKEIYVQRLEPAARLWSILTELMSSTQTSIQELQDKPSPLEKLNPRVWFCISPRPLYAYTGESIPEGLCCATRVSLDRPGSWIKDELWRESLSPYPAQSVFDCVEA